MRPRYLTAFAAVLAMSLAACAGGGTAGGGGDQQESAGLDCPRGIEFIVPYSAGGGSDRQVRRLQPHLESALDMSINVTYQTGGDGAVGWLALSNAEPNGCTVGNTVSPNIVLLSMSEEDVGFSYENFSYIGWTETGPITLTVSGDSEWQTVDDFVTAAKAAPGDLTVAGVGEPGELFTAAMTAATGIDVSYVPVSGGVGDIVPQLMGGQVDAGMLSSAAVADRSDTLRSIALTGDQEFPAFPDTPTFEGAGYDSVALTYAWGLALPPETPDEIVQVWSDALQTALSNDELRNEIETAGLLPLEQTPDEAVAFVEEQAQSVSDARAAVEGGS